MTLDPVTLEILGTRFGSTTEEMGISLQRTARTLYVKEAADFGTALAGLDGRFFAYPNGIGVCSFIDLDCSRMIAAVPDLQPGDVIISNHPYATGGAVTHTPDLTMIEPYFHDGRIVAYGWTFVHCSDIGGRVPSSISPSSTEIIQEGLLIPPLHLVRGGEFVPEILSMILANSRTPDDIVGDLKAMRAALSIGRRRVAEMIDKFGIETFMAGQEEIVAYARSKARAVFRTIPDGTYSFADYLDDDGVSRVPIRLQITMTVDDGRIDLDFTGTDPQTDSPYNIAAEGKRHPWLTLRLAAFAYTFDPSIPLNAGLFDDITVRSPSGTIVSPQYPAPVGIRHVTAQRVYETLNGALARALPQVMPACAGGVLIPVVLAEPQAPDGSRKVLIVEPVVGGMGARSGADGVDGRDCSIANLANNPLEVLEASGAVVVRRFGLRADSGGPGKWRGGVGLELEFEVLKDGCSVLGRGMDRFRFSPWALQGGWPGAKARTIVNRGTPGEREIGKIDVVQLNKDDYLTILTPGGGGFGDPLERSFDLVEQDLRLGLVSEAHAKQVYGVVVGSGEIDRAASRSLRRARLAAEPSAACEDPVRLAWTMMMNGATRQALDRLWQNVPIPQRSEAKRSVVTAAFNGTGEACWTASDLADTPPEAAAAALVGSIDRFLCGMPPDPPDTGS